MPNREPKAFWRWTALCCCAVGLSACFGQGLKHGADPSVLIQTDRGAIVVQVDTRNAPITAANFLRYVDEGRFSSASFYRTVRMDNQPNNEVKIEVIQGGIGFAESDLRLAPIPHETTAKTGLRHLDGTFSMARSEPGSASSEFFICIGDQPELDFGGRRNPDGQGFAAFGVVVEGMDVVRDIQSRPDSSQMLTEPVRIRGVRRLK
ncbi:MAG: peptidylprolyl isomerase [Rhodothermales bacterium]